MKALIEKMVAPIIMMVWASYYFAEVSGQNPQSQYLIRAVYGMSVVLFIIIAVCEIARYIREKNAEDKEIRKKSAGKKDLKDMIISVCGITIYLVLMQVAGFIISTLVFLFAAFSYVRVSKVKSALIAVMITILIYVSFKILLGVPLPLGVFTD